MILPEGIEQSTACMLLAIRDYLDDPKWEDGDLLENMRKNVGSVGSTAGKSEGWNGNFQEFSDLMSKIGLWCPEMYFPNQSGNDSYLTGYMRGKRYRWNRSTKTIVCYFTDTTKKSTHAMCLHVWQVVFFFDKLCWIALPRIGCIVDEVK